MSGTRGTPCSALARIGYQVAGGADRRGDGYNHVVDIGFYHGADGLASAIANNTFAAQAEARVGSCLSGISEESAQNGRRNVGPCYIHSSWPPHRQADSERGMHTIDGSAHRFHSQGEAGSSLYHTHDLSNA